MALTQTRRRFVAGLAAAGAAGLLHAPDARATEGVLETTAIRLVKNAGICVSPQYVAEKLLRDEGFTDIRYVDTPVPEISAAIARGKVDISMGYAAGLVRDIDAGEAVTVVGGGMVGCTELFAREGVSGITDLKGKSVGVQAIGSLPNILVMLMEAHVGLDPVNDIRWVIDPKCGGRELFVT